MKIERERERGICLVCLQATVVISNLAAITTSNSPARNGEDPVEDGS